MESMQSGFPNLAMLKCKKLLTLLRLSSIL